MGGACLDGPASEWGSGMRKVCTRCKVEKSASEFSKNASRRDGLCAYCRNCASEISRKHYAETPRELTSRRNRRYYAKKGGNQGMLATASAASDNKEAFVTAMVDDDMSISSAISFLEMRHGLKVLALAIAGSGSRGACRKYLIDTVYKRKCYSSLKADIFWLRRHLIGAGLAVVSLGYGKGYAIERVSA